MVFLCRCAGRWQFLNLDCFNAGNPNTVMALAGNKADMLEARQVPVEVCNPASWISLLIVSMPWHRNFHNSLLHGTTKPVADCPFLMYIWSCVLREAREQCLGKKSLLYMKYHNWKKNVMLELQEEYYADWFNHLGVNKRQTCKQMHASFSACLVLVVFHYMRENNILVSCHWVIWTVY
jgi:hypothetical protein